MTKPFQLTLLKAILILVTSFISLFVVGFVTYPIMHWMRLLGPSALSLFSNLLGVLSDGLIIYLFFLSGGHKFSFKPILGRPFHKVIWLSLMTLGAILLIEPLQVMMLSNVPIHPMLLDMMEQMQSQPVVMFIMIVVTAPLMEELLFRGVLLSGLEATYGPKLGIFFSAVLFGAIHLNWHQFLTATVIGLIYGWVALETKSVRYTIILHALNNAFVFFTQGFHFISITQSSLLTLALGLMLVTGLMVVFHRFFKLPLSQDEPMVTQVSQQEGGFLCQKDL